MIDERSRDAVEVAERYADGVATGDELYQAAVQSYEAAVAYLNGPYTDADLTSRAYYTTQESDEAVSVMLYRCGSGQRRAFVRDIFGNPFRPVYADTRWLTSAVVDLARTMYEARDFAAMPILADALQDAGCEDADILAHCRGGGPHVRGCWVVDLILGKA